MRAVTYAIATLAVAVTLTGCSGFLPDDKGSGKPVVLTDRSVSTDSFPYGAATPVPAGQLPMVLSDITLKPLQGDVDPANCTPKGVRAENAQVLVGPGGPETQGTITSVVAQTDESFDDYLAAARDCSIFRAGATGAQEVKTRLLDEPTDESGVPSIRLRRTLTDASGMQATVIDEWMAQDGNVRVYVQDRYRGDELPPEEESAVSGLFSQTVQAAFG